MQIATLNYQTDNKRKVTRKYLPYVFTEQGIAMLSGLLKNKIEKFSQKIFFNGQISKKQYYDNIIFWIKRRTMQLKYYRDLNEMLSEVNNIKINR